MIVTYVKRSLCLCGFPVLADEIQIGTKYTIDQNRRLPVTLVCGGCRKHIKVDGVWVESRNGGRAGYLPAEIFDIPSGLFA